MKTSLSKFNILYSVSKLPLKYKSGIDIKGVFEINPSFNLFNPFFSLPPSTVDVLWSDYQGHSYLTVLFWWLLIKFPTLLRFIKISVWILVFLLVWKTIIYPTTIKEALLRLVKTNLTFQDWIFKPYYYSTLATIQMMEDCSCIYLTSGHI